MIGNLLTNAYVHRTKGGKYEGDSVRKSGPESSNSAAPVGDKWQAVRGKNQESVMKFCIKRKV